MKCKHCGEPLTQQFGKWPTEWVTTDYGDKTIYTFEHYCKPDHPRYPAHDGDMMTMIQLHVLDKGQGIEAAAADFYEHVNGDGPVVKRDAPLMQSIPGVLASIDDPDLREKMEGAIADALAALSDVAGEEDA